MTFGRYALLYLVYNTVTHACDLSDRNKARLAKLSHGTGWRAEQARKVLARLNSKGSSDLGYRSEPTSLEVTCPKGASVTVRSEGACVKVIVK
jgi:hypothetical protein